MNKYIYLYLSIPKKEGFYCGNTMMEKTELLDIIKYLLKTDVDLDLRRQLLGVFHV
jgi:hypothetical protein